MMNLKEKRPIHEGFWRLYEINMFEEKITIAFSKYLCERENILKDYLWNYKKWWKAIDYQLYYGQNRRNK